MKQPTPSPSYGEGSELDLVSYRLFEDQFLATCEQELCPFGFLLASCQVSSSELHVVSYRLFEDTFLATCEQELCPSCFLLASCQVSSSELRPASYSNSDDIQAADSDTHPPMLDRTNYDSWSQRIQLYCRGKENGIYILQSIDHGPFELRTTRDTLGTTPEGKRFDVDVRASNIVLQGLPKDIYKLINHNIEAKAIWDNVKMLLARSELTKEDRESQLYDEFERFKMLPGENINEYYVRFHKLVNDMRNIRMTMPNIQLNSKFVNNMSLEWDRFEGQILVQNVQGQQNQNQRYFARGNGAAGFGGTQNRARNANAGQDDAEQPKKWIQDLARNEDNIFQADECDAFDSYFDDEPTAQSIFMANLSSAGPTNLQASSSDASILSEKTCKKRITPTGITEGERGFEKTKRCSLTKVIPFFNLLKEHFDSVQKSIITKVRVMKAVFQNMEAEVDQNVVDKKCGEIERKNLLITNENLIAECLSKDVFYPATDSVLNVFRFSDMHDAFTIAQKCIADLESENFNMRNKIQNDDHDSMIKHFSKLEVEHFNLQLKYQNLKERFGNKKPVTSSDAPSFDSLFVIGKLNEQIQSRGNTIRELKEKISRLTKKNSDADPIFDLKALVSQNKDLTAKLNALHDLNERFRAENAKVKQHYKELYDSIKITRAKTTDQNNSLLSEIENLKAQLKDNSKCVTIPDSKPKVLAPGRYPIDVEPIPPRLKKNREVHLHYIKHLKENVETLREIVEEAKVKRPLDTSLASACRYTKHSQELLEYVIGTCPKDFSPRDKQNASTNSLRKKRVTFVEPCETSTHNTPPQVEHQKINSTNAPGIPSTGVKGASAASRSKPRSNKKRIADLESENFNLRNKIQNDDHDSMIKHFSKLEVEHFNLQLKYQNLKERFGNKKPVTSSDAPSFDSLFNKDLTAKLNALHDLNERFRVENAKVKQHYKDLYNLIKITRAQTTDQNNFLLSEIENLKAQLKDNSTCVTIPDSKPEVLAPETLHEIVEDAKVERPLDTSLASACRYTKHSQELLECVIGTCPKDFSPRDKQNASTNSLRKNRVSFVEPCETSTHNTPPQVEHQKINSTNAPGIPSTGVNGASAASRSKPRSNTKKDRTLPAKSALKQVEAHSRMNKSNEKQKNRVDSSISYKRTVINSNSNTSCKTCNKCLISVNHDQCVVRSGMFVKQSPATKVWRVKQVKQVWKATGKLFTTIGHQWRPTGRLLPLGDQWPLTRNTPPKVLPTKQWKPTGRLLPLGR
ncbi:hypothetical protein Tco_0300773 [Tanacetum coccineum]